VRTAHFPATSPSEIMAGVAGATAVVSLAGCSSDLAQPIKTAAEQQETRWRMTPSVVEEYRVKRSIVE